METYITVYFNCHIPGWFCDSSAAIEYIKDYLFGFCVLNSKFGVNIHNFVKICCNYSKKVYNICILGNCINSSFKLANIRAKNTRVVIKRTNT